MGEVGVTGTMEPSGTRLRILMISPAPVLIRDSDFILDGKFVEGMVLHSQLWEGDCDCILREGAESIPFGPTRYDATTQGFGMKVLKPDDPITADHLAGYDLIFCSVDDDRNLNVPALAQSVGAKLATTLEYTLQTRLQILWLDRNRSLLRRIYGTLKLLRNEIGRRKFLAAMDGIQANGYPGYEMCQKFDPETLLFLDNRMARDMFVTTAELEARKGYLLAGEPLRLVYSGRLERMKGVHHLIPVATRLRDLGTPFTLEIFGAGSLKETLRAEIEENGLAEIVSVCDAVDFETELVPHLRASCDIYLCCHLQADPSCSYIENMGCGLAVIGYDNRMWAALCAASKGGWSTALGKPDLLASKLAEVEKDRPEIARRCADATAFSKEHDFHTESTKRMDHLMRIARKAS